MRRSPARGPTTRITRRSDAAADDDEDVGLGSRPWVTKSGANEDEGEGEEEEEEEEEEEALGTRKRDCMSGGSWCSWNA